jgi:phosphate transport system substrate-binding protein
MLKKTHVAAALSLVGLFAASVAHAQVIKIDGSSTVYPITEAVAEEFQKAKKNAIKVTVGISGTGGGFKKFCRGETDFANASRPITAKEMEDCKAAGVEYVEMPVAFRCADCRHQPEEHLPQAGYCRRNEEAVGAGSTGHRDQMEPG